LTSLSRIILPLFALAAALIAAGAAQSGETQLAIVWRDGDALWMRRHWLHEEPSKDEIAALVESLRERGISRIYPFLGPMDGEGWPDERKWAVYGKLWLGGKEFTSPPPDPRNTAE
jgi:hypothetical protein